MESTEVLIICIITIIVSFVTGILFGLNIADGNIENKICKQLYTNTTNYLNCKSDNDLDKYIKKIQPIGK